MSQRLGALVLTALVIVACSSGGPTTAPAGQPTQPPDGAPTQQPAEQPTQPGAVATNPPNAGNMEALARALMPQGATETGEFQAGGMYQLHATSTLTLDQLEAFWDQQIPSLGMTLTGKYTAAEVLTIAITNPDGGIVAAPDGEGGIAIAISLGISQ